MSSTKRKSSCSNGVDNLGLDVDIESDDETIIYADSCDGSVNLSSDEFSSASDATESDCDDFVDVRVWCKVDPQHPSAAPPWFPFTGQPGLQVPVADSDDPLAYLRLFLDDEIMDTIVSETNQYAEQTMTRTGHRCLSRTRQWEPVTKDDMWLFFGILVLQSLIHKPRHDWYWSRKRLLLTPVFQDIMSEYKFSLIMKFLHFTNNDEFDESTHPSPKLKKIWNVYQALLCNFQKAYTPRRDVSVDESLMAFKERLGWIQYIASRWARFGVKFYALCESQTGYIWNSVLYTGKGTKFNEKYGEYGISTSSVLSLIDGLLGKGYCVTMDNFYTSPELFEVLIQNKTDAYGTVRSNRRNLPPDFPKEKLKKGEVAAWQKGKMIALKWKDKKDVCLISTVHNAASSIVKTKKGQEILKPNLVLDYNHTMGGVDKADQELTYYPVMRKQQKRYYKKVFRHFLEQCLWNAYILFLENSDRQSSSSKAVEHADFQLMIVDRLFMEHMTVVTPGKKPGRRSLVQGNLERLTGRHFIDHVPPTTLKTQPTRMCVVCCARKKPDGKKVRKETRFCCLDCDVGLCAVPCFKDYHQKVHY